VALDGGEAGAAEPVQLVAEVGEAVGGVVLGAADLAAEAFVQLPGRGLDQIEVGEDAARRKEVADLGEELPLALVLEMVDREPGDDRVIGPPSGSGSPRSCCRSSVAGPSPKRCRARSSIGCEKSSPTASASGWAVRTRAIRRPSPVPRSRRRSTRWGSAVSNICSATSRCGISRAR